MTNTWQEFCAVHYDEAIASARYHLGKFKASAVRWDNRIDEDILVEDAVMNALQNSFTNFNPARGASEKTYLSRAVHNELLNELDREIKSLPTASSITPSQEAEYTFKEVALHIPEQAFDDLRKRLHDAILKLSPIDQAILGFFLDDPKTFVERSAQELNVTPNYVSTHKNRAIAQLPKLMGMTSDDYFKMFEEFTYANRYMTLTTTKVPAKYNNPIYSQFDLDSTIAKLYNAICSAK